MWLFRAGHLSVSAMVVALVVAAVSSASVFATRTPGFGVNQTISLVSGFAGEEEPTLARDSRSGQIYAGWKLTRNPDDAEPYRIGFSTSRDGGATWSRTRVMEAPASSVWQSDPWLAVAPDGSVWFSRADYEGVYVSRSDDGGQTWTAVTTLTGPMEAPATDADRVAVAPDGTVYVAFAVGTGRDDAYRGMGIAVISSRDNGATWSPPAVLDRGREASGAALVALAGGRVDVAWTDYSPVKGDRIMSARSTDYGSHWSIPVVVTPRGQSVSEKFGNTWSSMTSTGPGLLLAWSQSLAHRPAVVVTARSRNDGRTWSKPHPIPGAGQQIMPAVTAAPGGAARAIWYAIKGRWISVQSATSADAGATWSRPTVASKPSIAMLPTGRKGRYAPPRLGDYMTIVSDTRAVAYAVWTDFRNSSLRIVFASTQT